MTAKKLGKGDLQCNFWTTNFKFSFVNKTKLKLKSSTEKGGTKTQTLQNITEPDLI